MKKNIFFKLFTIAVLLICSVPCVFAAVNNMVGVKKLYVEPLNSNAYSISIYFNNQYKDKAFLQKLGTGSYSIFLPNSFVDEKKLNIKYKNKRDKKNIDFNFEQKPYLSKTNDSRYVKINITMNKDYSLQLLSKNIKDEKITLFSNFDLNFTSLLLVLLGLSMFLLLKKVVSAYSPSYNRKNYNFIPESFYLPQINLNFSKTIKASKPSASDSLKSMDSKAFSCFDINQPQKTQGNPYNYKSSIKETTSILSKTKQTSPIQRNVFDESLKLDLPYATKDVVADIQKDNTKEIKPELLSVLHITPSIGFYLTNSAEVMSLFGFVGDSVFHLKSFNDLAQINLQARYYDKNGDNDVYIVRLDTYKAMVEISKDSMKELVVL